MIDVDRDYGWLLTEVATWGERRMGGLAPDGRSEERARADLPRLEYAERKLRDMLELHRIEFAAGRAVGDDTKLVNALAQAERLAIWTRRRIASFEGVREEQAFLGAQQERAAQLREQLGGEAPPPALSIDAWRLEMMRKENAIHEYEMSLVSQAERDARDPNTPAGKARVKRELDSRDVALQSQLGNPIPPADGDGRSASEWKPVEAPAEPAHRSLLDNLRRAVSR